jgi:hypothetical protein
MKKDGIWKKIANLLLIIALVNKKDRLGWEKKLFLIKLLENVQRIYLMLSFF